MEEKKCYLCGASIFEKRPGKVRDNSKLDILECVSCGLVFLSSSNHIVDSFYKDSRMHQENEILDIEAWLMKTEWDDERRARRFGSMFANKRVLDFGCGAGGFLRKIKDTCSNADGLELEKRLQPFFKKNHLTVFLSLEDFKHHYEYKYDFITLFHVLEHLPDPRNVLKELSGFLNEGGQIIIETPSSNDAVLTLYKNKAFSEFTYWSCHLYLFNEETLRLLSKQLGLLENYIKQIQRYPLSNHLYWLSYGLPGGHEKWSFLNSENLDNAYENQLAKIGRCDTILANFSI